MAVTSLREGLLTLLDYHCEAGPHDPPYAEWHTRHSLSYVRRGSFGCRTRGKHHSLLAGGFLVGCPGDEFTCTHEHHHGGDECLSIQLAPELVETMDIDRAPWRHGSLAPLPDLSLYAQLTQACVEGDSDVGIVDSVLAVLERFARLTVKRKTPRHVSPRARRAVCRAADWIEAHSARDIDLLDAARHANLSPYHFLRSFHAVLGITPHQHLVRCRLRKAARHLLDDDTKPISEVALAVGYADLSNFVRSFKRASGVPPSRFRRLTRARQAELRNSVPTSWFAAATR